MQTETVFLFEEQIIELFRNTFKSGDYLRGVAYSYDNDTVFHAFPRQTYSKGSSDKLSCMFVFTTSLDFLDYEKKSISKFQNLFILNSQPQKYLVVILSLNFNNQLKQKSFFVKKNIVSEIKTVLIPRRSDIYSRSRGILETGILEKKKVSIVGLGSGGSSIAIELVKSGVGNLVLIDFDRIEFSNVSRHICGLEDLGRYKTFAVRDLILQKNPYCNVVTYEIDINKSIELFRNSIHGSDLIICATDTTRSRFNVNQVSISNNIVSIFGRAITRAAGGDVLRVRPFKGPCLNCLFSQGVVSRDEDEFSQERQVKSELPAYTSQEEINSIIQVGLSTDILPISIMMTKLALVELSRGHQSGISTLEEDLISDFYIWANRRERIYSNWPKMEYNFNKQTILRWYGAKVRRDINCDVCGLIKSPNSTSENIFR